MKKLLLILTSAIFFPYLLNAGGIVTNTNQSATWVRTITRDASTGIDAVYFNPAGLVRLDNGFHFSLNNQTIFQSKDVTTDYRFLLPDSTKTFLGDVKAPVFPSIYAAYKIGKFAISFGFNPIGGGGGATLEDGIPMTDMLVADLRKAYELQGATDYRMDAYLKGSSVFFGYQAGLSYAINDMISVFAGLRYVTAKNTYEGHLNDVELLMPEPAGWMAASDILLASANTINTSATNLNNAITAGLLGADDPISFELGLQLQMLGITPPAGFTNQMAVGALQAAGAGMNLKAGLLDGQELDNVQKGAGFTPIVGVCLSLFDKLTIGAKYEFKTSIELENETAQDFIFNYTAAGLPITMFPDGEKFNNDLPAMLAVGVNYKIIKKLSASAGFRYYFDRSADYSKKVNGEYVANDVVIDKNYYEINGGLEFDITDKLVVSAGYSYSKPGVSEDYQSELSFSLPANTFGGGFGFRATENFMINLGCAYTMYSEGTKSYQHVYPGPGAPVLPVKDTYFKSNLIAAIGLDISF